MNTDIKVQLKETCPKCGERLEMDRNCNCSEREKGWLVVKRCPGCDYSAKWNPSELFGGKDERSIEDSKSIG